MTQKKLSLSIQALRRLLEAGFDAEQYARGRRDAVKAIANSPKEHDHYRETAAKMLENGSVTKPGPAYWIGCLTELDML